ncbi:SUR7/PalI family-domain-containing protein [Xylariaceae sp. FL0594]|nr:SUR7/PalI family-domain-containing protein [Xylariaceae sp. FL0594]
MGIRKPASLHWAIPIFASLLSLLFTLTVLLSGTGGRSPATFVDVTNLVIPAKLSSSKLLQDLSMISGSDLVGNERTRQSLGLAQTYSVSLLTVCGRHEDGSTTCYPARVGFAFDPLSDLHIGSLVNQGTLPSPSFFSQLRKYAAASTFASVAYILSSLLIVTSCASVLLSRRCNSNDKKPRLVRFISRSTSFLAAVLLIAATVDTSVTFIKVRDAYNSAFSGIGVTTTLAVSGAISLSVAASVLAFVAFLLVLFVRPPVAAGAGYDRKVNNFEENAHLDDLFVGAAAPAGLMSRGSRPGVVSIGLLDRVPTWKQGRYVQIGNQKNSRDPSPESDREGLIAGVQDVGIAHRAGEAPDASGYPQSAWEKRRGRSPYGEAHTAYEPNAMTA